MTAKQPCRPQLLHKQHVNATRCYAAPGQHGTQILSSPSPAGQVLELPAFAQGDACMLPEHGIGSVDQPDDEVTIDAFGILAT